MAIIVEINSNKKQHCCRENKIVLQEFEFSDITKFLTGQGKEGDAASESFRTQISKSVIDSVLKSILPPSIINNRLVYRGLVNTLATIDLDDYHKLGFGNPSQKEDSCKLVASKLTQGLENTIIEMATNAITQKIRDLAPEGDADSPFTRIFGDLLRTLSSSGNFAAQLVAGAFTEDVKGTITTQVAEAICQIDFSEVAKKAFGSYGGLINKGLELGGGIGKFFTSLFKEEIDNGKYGKIIV